ncbi:MAG: pyridoxal-phosphate dependent enzyme [Myxococcales bacterium]|nr:pyridoxal-phosphate dependent enzyme [Myxococcales bacterium]
MAIEISAPAPSAADIDFASLAVARLLPESPLESWDGLQMKCEHRLPTGAFKVRGAVTVLSRARELGMTHVVAASAGNHGVGLAWAGSQLGIQPQIVVPRDCPEVKRRKMEAYCRVLVCAEPGYDAAERWARLLATQEGVPFVSPFDDTLVMAGNGGTLMREVLAACPDVQTVVVPVGGGGLLVGILSVLRTLARRVRVVTVQSEASPAFTRSLQANQLFATWPATETLAEGLEGGAGATSVVEAQRYGVQTVTVTEAEIATAMVDAWRNRGQLLEGSAAVVCAAWRSGYLNQLEGPIVGVLTGGNVAQATIEALDA